MAHMMACFWYMIGKSEQLDGAGSLVQGWVYNAEGKGWSDSDLNPTCEPVDDDATAAVVPLRVNSFVAYAMRFTIDWPFPRWEI